MPGWQEETGLLDLFNGVRPRPPVLFAPSAAVAPSPNYPLTTSQDEAPAIRTPDPGGPSFDRLREILGQGPAGVRAPVPQIFNQGVEQHPLARPDDLNPQRSTAWQLYDAGRSFGTPTEIAARRNAIIGRHNLNQDLQNEYLNMGRGMYSIPRAESTSRTGVDPTLGLGTEGRTVGAHETAANAQNLEAMTRAATLEQALSPAMQRQRFMERFPHLPPAQLNELVAGEEARGGFAPRVLRFPISGTPAAAPRPAGATPAPQSLFLNDVAAATPFADAANQAVPRLPNTADIGVGEFMSRLAQSNPGVFATPANRTALRPYLESRFGRSLVEQAMQGTRSLGPIHSGAGQSILGNLLAAPFRGGRMTPEQEGRAMLEAALNRNQF